MIWIKPAWKWNPHDFLAARRLKNAAFPSAKEVRWWEHLSWWWGGGWRGCHFLLSGRQRIGYARVNHLGTVSVMVEEEYRGHGYGFSLLYHLRWAEKGTLIANIASDNAASLALFRRAGYEESPISLPSGYRVMVSYDR